MVQFLLLLPFFFLLCLILPFAGAGHEDYILLVRQRLLCAEYLGLVPEEQGVEAEFCTRQVEV